MTKAWPGFSVEAGLSVSREDGRELVRLEMNSRMNYPGGIIGAAG